MGLYQIQGIVKTLVLFQMLLTINWTLTREHCNIMSNLKLSFIIIIIITGFNHFLARKTTCFLSHTANIYDYCFKPCKV